MFKKILAPIDLDHTSVNERLLSNAEEMANLYNAELHVITVIPDYSMSIVGSFFPKEHEKQALEVAQVMLKDILSTRTAPAGGLKGHVAHGTIYDEITKAADKLGCDLIIMASNRPELKDYLLGPNAARVVRHARQSVFVVRPEV